MEKIKIESDVIKEYLGTEEKFASTGQFCDWLLGNKDDTDIKIGLKKMLADRLLADNKDEKNKIKNAFFQDRVEWVRLYCCMEDEETDDGNPSQADESTIGEGIAESDYDKIKEEYELSGYKSLTPLEEDELDYTEGFTLHEGGIINQQSGVQIYVLKKGLKLDISKILIAAPEGNAMFALGYLVPDANGSDYTVVFDRKEWIEYQKFSDVNQVRFVIYDKKGKAYSRLVDIEYKPFHVEVERPLCIDFGTSNTTVGSYGILDHFKDEAEIVKFIDVTVEPNNTEAPLLPTVVYVEDCSDPDNIKYLFGYEARKRIEAEHYESKASVYYEIKRWLLSADEEEPVRDNDNHKATPLKKEIIKAYIDYVIEYAEQYFGTRFKKLHFSAPVKLKEQSIKTFKALYKNEKEVLTADQSIDEGIAIVYNKIISMTYSNNKEIAPDEKRSIMIMDCGGGTTDLASCEFSYKNTDAGVELVLDTCFENGNSNFGGNNITYRIMQLLKVKIAALLRQDFIDHNGEIIKLIDKSENDILGLVEQRMGRGKNAYDSDDANNEVYKLFLENYKKAEEVIPTCYVGNEKYRGSGQLKMIKRNFYYLWRQAEQIKIDFYRTERVLMEFKDGYEDAKIDIRNHDNYYLYVANDEDTGLAKFEKPFDKVSITIKEINRVICGDIYSLLVGLFQNGELTSQGKKVDEFDFYKLSGQSCKISLFSELIKEYIPGRKLRPAPSVHDSEKLDKRNSEDLKLDCVLGCINYIKDQMRPEMKVVTNPRTPEIIYNILLKGGHNNSKKLFDCSRPDEICMEISHKNTREFPLLITSKDDVVERDFIFELAVPNPDGEVVDTETISKILSVQTTLSQDGIDKFISELSKRANAQKEDVNIIFMVPSKQGYGFHAVQLYVHNSKDSVDYRILQFKNENFEDASKTFFDGRR